MTAWGKNSCFVGCSKSINVKHGCFFPFATYNFSDEEKQFYQVLFKENNTFGKLKAWLKLIRIEVI